VLSVIVLACYLACAAWLASSVYRAGEHAAHGRRIAGVALGLIALVLHAVLLWRGLFDRPVLSFTIAETASLIGWPIGLIAVGASWLRPRFAGIGAVLTVVAGVVAATTVRGGGGAPRPFAGGFGGARPSYGGPREGGFGGGGGAPSAPGARQRDFGPDAPPKGKKKNVYKSAAERGPKGPIRTKTDNRIYNAFGDEAEDKDAAVDFDDFATSKPSDEPADKPGDEPADDE